MSPNRESTTQERAHCYYTFLFLIFRSNFHSSSRISLNLSPHILTKQKKTIQNRLHRNYHFFFCHRKISTISNILFVFHQNKTKIIFSMESLWVQTAISAIRVIAFVCDVITFPVYLVLQQPWKRRQLSKRIKVSNSLSFSFLIILYPSKLPTILQFV